MHRLIDSIVVYFLRHRFRGATRLRNIFCRSRRLPVRTKHGIRLMVDPFQGIDTVILESGFYEEEVYRAVARNLKPHDVFWDVGANLGLHSLTVKSKFPSVDVFAFEPNPAMVSLLHRSCDTNGLEINIHPVALDAHDGSAEFFIHADNAGRCGMYNRNADPDLPRLNVETSSGDSLIADGAAKPPNVIKIDVEGHELPALHGIRRVLESPSLRAVVFEDVSDQSSPVKQFLSGYGFAIDPLTRMEGTHHNLENYVATRAA